MEKHDFNTEGTENTEDTEVLLGLVLMEFSSVLCGS
jgi:hypothetical protein